MIAAETGFAHSGRDAALLIAFTVLMGIAAASDVRSRRIPNSIVVLIFALGALFLMKGMGVSAGSAQLLEGAGTGLIVWIPMWLIGKLGAGDVKFFAAGAAWLGPHLALNASVTSALLGGALALVFMGRRKVATPDRMEILAPRVAPAEGEVSRETLPYGVAMAAGLTLTAWFPHLIR